MDTLHDDLSTFMTVSCWILLGMRFFQTTVVQKIKTHISCSKTFYKKSCHLWDVKKNMLQDKPHITQHMRFAYWITKDTDMTSAYVILIACPWQQWLHKNTSVLHYMYAACLVSFQFLQIFPAKIQKPGDMAFYYKAFNTRTREQ
jgi:hypothetical protein